MPDVRQVCDPQAVLGEGPIWDQARGLLWFVDIKRHRLWHFDPASGSSAFAEAPEQIGWVIPAEGGQLLAGLQDGLYLFDPETETFAKLSDVPGEPAHNRLNDACADPAGRVWFGSMDDDEKLPTGRFYQFDRGEIIPAGPADICITNGPAVSPDGRTIYFTDTMNRQILAADLKCDGLPGPARLFADMPIRGAYPDGPVVDSEGYLWTGLWNGWSVIRFAPDGSLDRQIKVPAANCTKLAFGGADYKTLYITTACKGLDAAALAEQPVAGSVFAVESDIAGAPVTPAKLS